MSPCRRRQDSKGAPSKTVPGACLRPPMTGTGRKNVDGRSLCFALRIRAVGSCTADEFRGPSACIEEGTAVDMGGNRTTRDPQRRKNIADA